MKEEIVEAKQPSEAALKKDSPASKKQKEAKKEEESAPAAKKSKSKPVQSEPESPKPKKKAAVKTPKKPAKKKEETEREKRKRNDDDNDDDSDSSDESNNAAISCPLSKIAAVEAELQCQQEVFSACTPVIEECTHPITDSLQSFYSEVSLTSSLLSPPTTTMKPMTRMISEIKEEDEPQPPTNFLATGIPFINKIRWCPTMFGSIDGKSYTHPYRYLLIQGTRVPIEIVIGATENGRCYQEGTTEVKQKECALFSRIIQMWKIAVPAGPTAGFDKKNLADDNISPTTFELTLPKLNNAADDLWQPRDIQWWGKDSEEANAAILLNRFCPASADHNRVGIFAVVTSHSHVSIYGAPRETDSHGKLSPYATCHDKCESPFTCVTWHVKKGEISLYCGMANGDVSCVYVTSSDGSPHMFVTNHIRLQCVSGLVKEILILPMWYTDSVAAVGYDSDDSCADFNHKMPVHNWESTCRDRLGKFRLFAPDHKNVRIVKTDVMTVRCFSDKRIRLVDMTQVGLGHVLPAHTVCKGKSLPTSTVTTSYGTLIVGLDDGTISVFGKEDSLTFQLKHSSELQSGIQNMSYITDERRRDVVSHKRRLRLSGVTGRLFVRPKSDSLLAYVSSNGMVGILRWAKQALMFGSGKRSCKGCRTTDVKSSWNLASCCCYAKGSSNKSNGRASFAFTEDTSLLIIRDVNWSLPKTAEDPPRVSLNIITDVSEGIDFIYFILNTFNFHTKKKKKKYKKNRRCRRIS